MIKKAEYLNILNELLTLLSGSDQNMLNQIYFRTLTLLDVLYGANNRRVAEITKFKADHFDKSPWNDGVQANFRSILMGVINGLKSDIENDLIFNLEKQTIGSVVADFVVLAKNSAEDGNKDVAAVLASAAIEDSLKRYSAMNDLQADDKEMSEIINALKSQGLLKGPQASVLASYTKTRNKAFHAEWDKIEMPEVKSLITFTEEFIIQNLS